uniref:Retrovirus-related Pol polyprotein from transposon TNT 1-94-like beta-barrel domain-containing protein n=1 Tax=Chenopodium quinoa TaxID=63459 RepID=A0A803MQH5_CHEQI
MQGQLLMQMLTEKEETTTTGNQQIKDLSKHIKDLVDPDFLPIQAPREVSIVINARCQMIQASLTTQYNQILEVLNKYNNRTNKQDQDSGGSLGLVTSDHLTDLKMFSSYHRVHDNNFYITILDGSRVMVENVRSIKLDSKIELLNVLHVPGFQFNLISIPKLCKDNGFIVSFTSDVCLVQDLSISEQANSAG